MKRKYGTDWSLLWPDVVQERLDPNGPTNRLIDIEEEYMVQKQQELDDLHERMRKTLPR